MGKIRSFILYISFIIFTISLVPYLKAQEAEAGNGKTDAVAPAENASSENYATIPLDSEGKPLPLTLDQVVHLVLDNNRTVQLQQLEIIKSDTDLMKENSKYAPVLGFSYQGYEKQDKLTPLSYFQGTKLNQDTYETTISKLFSSGTYFQVGASDSRYDTNAGEGLIYQGTLFSSLAMPPLWTGALSVLLRQELLKNSFGYSQRRINDIARNNARIKREELTFQLSQLVVKAMVDYWNLSISEENVMTSELLYNNTTNIRDITLRKTGIGLAEPFEVNQWNALVAQAETNRQRAMLDRDSKRRELLRVMHLDPEMHLTGASKLIEEIPGDFNLEKDIAYAYKTRPDMKNITLQKENTRLAVELAENNLLPSMTLSGKYATRDQGLHSYTSYYNVPYGKYPEASVEFKVQYPLWDDGARVDVRNAKIALRQLNIQEEQLRRQIRDDLTEAYEQIKAAYDVLQRTKYAVNQTETFYNRLLVRYRQGRFTAESVKNALDSLVQARLGLMQARINFNIALVRYDMVRNNIWDRFQINIDSVIDRMMH